MSTPAKVVGTILGIYHINDERRMSNKHRCKAPTVWEGEYLYKYGRIDTPERLDWLEQIVLRHQLYIPTPGELNDPLEARPKIARASMDKFIGSWRLETYATSLLIRRGESISLS